MQMPDPLKAVSAASPAPDPAADPLQDSRTLIALVRGMDHAQNAQLEATSLLRDEVSALHGLLAHLIQILTPEQPEDEGPSLRELLALIIQQQREIARLTKENLATSGRIETRLGAQTPPENAAVS
jgi:hypothetical protein